MAFVAYQAGAQTTTGNPAAGATLWQQRCQACHAATGVPLNAANAGGHITYAISRGMPSGSLTATEANDIAAYLGTLLPTLTRTVLRNGGPVTLALPGLHMNTQYGNYNALVVLNPPAKGSISGGAGGTLVYTPFANQSGADSFTWQAVNGSCFGACSSERTVSINIVTTPPPPNDDFAARIALGESPTSAAGTTGTAGKEAGEPAHAGNGGGKSVWWTWTAPVDGEVHVTTVGSSFDTLLAVYTGTAVNALTPIAANDDCGGACGNPAISRLAFNASAGVTYHVAVDGKNGASGNASLYLYYLQGAQVIDFPAQASPRPLAPFLLDPPATGGGSGLPVTYGSATPEVCSILGIEVTPLDYGTCTITADQDGNAAWYPADTVLRDIVIAPPAVTLVAARLKHGNALLPVDLAAALDGEVTTEPRDTGGVIELEMQFSGPVVRWSGVSVVDGAGNVVSGVTAAASGSTLTLRVGGIADATRLRLRALAVNDGAHATVSVAMLGGDATASRRVTAADIAAVKARRGRAIASDAHRRLDLDGNGMIDDADVARAKAASARTLP